MNFSHSNFYHKRAKHFLTEILIIKRKSNIVIIIIGKTLLVHCTFVCVVAMVSKC